MSESKERRMREESEIVAMRDKLERYALQHYGLSDQGLAALAALRWVTDPTISDGELLAITAGETRFLAVATN